jgi:ABC-type sugar transport system permease subunit
MREKHTTTVLSRTGSRALPFILLAPFFITFLVFFAFPAIYSLVLSFYNYRGYGEARFVGLGNYIALINFRTFWKSVGNTFFYFIMHFIPVMLGALLLAFAMQSKAIGKSRKIFKPIIFLPQIVPVIATALIFRIIFATRSGAVNQLLGMDTRWLEDVNILRWIIVLMVIWRATGWFMVVFLAGLTTISNDLYEAAVLDGATTRQKMQYITIPLMRPFFLFAFIMDTISSLKIFVEPNILWPAQANPPTDIAPMMNMITQNIRGGNFGMASAAGWLLFLIVLVVSLGQLFLLRNRDKGKQ